MIRSGDASPQTESFLQRFAGQKVVVLGDAMLDRYSCGTTRRLCPDAPAPVVELGDQLDLPGGAANSAANARLLGADVTLLARIGDDEAGGQLARSLQALHVDTSRLIVTRRQTLVKHRVVCDHQVLVRCDSGATEQLDEPDETRLLHQLTTALSDAHVVIVSDYSYGVMTPRVIAELARWHRIFPESILAVDARSLTQYKRARATLVKPNQREAAALLQLPVHCASTLMQHLLRSPETILHACGSQMAAVTLDADGSLILEHAHRPLRVPAVRVAGAQVSGAGDTYLTAFAMALAAQASTRQAAEFASQAAAVAVEKPFTATCSIGELRRRAARELRSLFDDDLGSLVAGYRSNGQRIVLTCGCFDILHRGHVTYLAQAKALGDILIVAVNSDDSVARLKGPSRPVNSLADRLCVLAALGCVDHLIPFSEDRPDEVIRRLKPDIFVKGGDYCRETLAEASLVESLGGRVEFLPLVTDRSTTKVIQRISQHAAPCVASRVASGPVGVSHEALG